jgi:hypothetical protein
MDRITQSLLKEFQAQHSLLALTESRAFERFANYLVVCSQHQEAFDTADVSVDDDSVGIDGIAILANGALLTTPEEVADYVQSNGYLDVTFVFTQAKTTAGFDIGTIGGMEFAVADFFKEKPQLIQTDFVKNAAEIANEIIAHSSKFTRGKPACRLFYVSTGKWVNDTTLLARAAAAKAALDSLGLFREVTFTPIDADRIQKLYNQSKNAVSREFTFERKVLVPEIDGVSESYLGILPAKEFLKLIQDDGEIIKSLFYDNVRDWQSYNAVNEEIRKTIADASGRKRFVLMNNGVTIITKTLRTVANKFHIEDFQIVNGCQTSHVLHDQATRIDDSVYIPIRVIATQDEDIISSIIAATNRQTEVEEEQFLALSDFQKKLEAYFNTFEGPKQVHYERRSRQYSHMTSIEKVRIVNMKMLLRAFASIILQEPHRTTRSYKTLLEGVGKTIFSDQDKLEPYYTAAYTLYKLEYYFRNGTIQTEYKSARYHVLMTFGRLAAEHPLPKASSREIVKSCNKINSVLWDDLKAAPIFHKACRLVYDACGGTLNRDDIRSQPFTAKLQAALAALKV